MLSATRDLARRVGPSLRRRWTEFRLRRLTERTRRLVLRTPPIPVRGIGSGEVHILTCRRDHTDAIAGLKSFYRFAPAAYPLVVHDDGTIDGAAAAALRSHFPGARVILRAEADATIEPLLQGAGLHRLLELRRRFPLALKLIDVIVFGAGRNVLLLDSDVIFLKPPLDVLEALDAPPDEFVPRFNEDVRTRYCWTAEQIQAHVGIAVMERYNAGLQCVRIEQDAVLDQLAFFERCLEMPPIEGRSWYPEQSLWAIKGSRDGARALPPEYDVCARLRRHGIEDLVAHHCVGHQAAYFHEKFASEVYPSLIRRGDPARERPPVALPEAARLGNAVLPGAASADVRQGRSGRTGATGGPDRRSVHGRR